MDKSIVVAGSAFGVTAILIAFVFMANPPVTVQPEYVTDRTGLGSLQVETVDVPVRNAPAVDESVQIASNAPEGTLTLAQIFAESESGVVRVNVERQGGTAIMRSGVGSGFVYDTDGHIITNAHVVENAQKITITFLDGSQYRAEFVGADPFTDIAVVRVDAGRDLLHPLKVGDSAELRVGEEIAAIGNPFGLSGSMTAGIVSQLGRLLPAQEGDFQIPDVIQTDAAINPGNSGGPLLDMRGRVVGINTAIQSATGEFAGIGFAVPSKTISKIVPGIISEGQYLHPWIGISGRDINPDLAKHNRLDEASGFLVVGVATDSPADRAGIHGSDEVVEIDGARYPDGGDIIVGVDGNKVRKIDDILIHLQREKAVGDSITLQVVRDGRTSEFVLVLDTRPSVQD